MGHSLDYFRNSKRVSHRWLTLLLLFYVLTAIVYTLILPLGEAADEAEHFALIRFIAEEHRPPLTLKEQHSISAKGDASPIYHGLVALLTQHVDVSELSELPDPRHQLRRAIPYDRLPFKGLYHTEDELFPFRGIVLAWHLARLVSIPLGVTTIIAIYMIVLAITPQRPYFALAAAGFAAFVPRFVINNAIVSDDNLVIPLIAFSIYYLVRIAQGDEQRRTFVFLGILMGLAAISKYHSLLLLPETTIMLVILIWKNGWGWRLGLRRWGLTMLAFLLTAGGWFAFLIIQFNQIADLGWFRGLIAPLGDPIITSSADRFLNAQSGNLAYEPELGWLEWAWLLFRTFWFRYGRGDVIDSPAVNGILGLVALLAIVGLASLGLRNRRYFTRQIRKIETWRLDIILLVLHFFIYFSIVVIRYVTLPTRETAQGRHLYPALMTIAFFFILGLSQAPQLFAWLSHRTLWTRFEKRSLPAFDKFMAFGVSGIFIGFAGLTLPLFIVPTYYPYLPIRRIDPTEASIQHRFSASLAEGIEFTGYTVASPNIKAAEAIPVTLYWQARTAQIRDYLVQLCLYGASDQPVTCRLGHPADGRYPMRTWETGYLIRDAIYLPTPYCLPADDYELRLSVLPLRLDTAYTMVDDEIKLNETLPLGPISISKGSQEQTTDFALWVGNEQYQRGRVDLKQIRQALTVISYQPEVIESNELSQVELLPTPSDPVIKTAWSPVTTPTIYTCPDGTMASVHNFIVDTSVTPETYHLMVSNQTKSEPLVTVLTHPRNFSLPADITTEVHASFGGEVELIGYNLDLSPRLPDDTLDIEVYWRSLNTMQHRYVGSIHLLDNSVNMLGQIDHVLGNNFEYPNILWAPGEVIDQLYQLPISRQTPPGLYTLEFGVYDNTFGDFSFLPVSIANSTEPAKQLNLGRIRIMDPDRTKIPDHPMAVELGNQIKLLGYDLTSEQLEFGEPLKLALHWQALSQPNADYTVFTQLVGLDGLVWGQQDNQPQRGRYPTTAWTESDKVVDRYDLTLKDGAPHGQYRLLVGMYEAATGQRLTAITADGNQLPDNAILLTTFLVE